MWPVRADFLWRELGEQRSQLGLISSLSFLPVSRKYPHQQKKNGKGFQRCSRDRGPVNLLGTKMHGASVSLLNLGLAVNNGRTRACRGYSLSIQYLPRMHPRNQAVTRPVTPGLGDGPGERVQTGGSEKFKSSLTAQ